MDINNNLEIQEFLLPIRLRSAHWLSANRALLDERGIIKLQSADFYKTLDHTDLRGEQSEKVGLV